MLIYAIDDEPAMLEELRDAIAEAAPDAGILEFRKAQEALDALEEPDKMPDVVFSDIRLPGMDGLSLAVQIKKKAPKAKIVFVTGYTQYAVEAYRRHVNGYVMKPVTPDKIRAELCALDLPPAAPEPGKLCVRCFGAFDVFWNDKPLTFSRNKTRELLAYLVDREGAYCTRGEIALALWEGEGDDQSVKNRVRVLLNDLRATLRKIGMEDVLIEEKRQIAVRRDRIDCDYYRMRAGDAAALNAYHGDYMRQYSWAELTNSRLHFMR